jgi:exodeoxyribonuclease V beta subunit
VEGRRGPRALVEWLQRMRADAAARTTVAAESAQIRLESDTRALKLITIHKSKGLQFPVVVCPFLWDGMLLHPSEQAAPFHDPADGDRLTIDLGSAHIDQHRALAKREALAEKLRLLYVALSRAEQLCIVAWGAFATCETSALGYLLHQPGPSTGGDLMAETSRRICELADAEMRADVERVAERSEGAIEVVDLTADPAPRLQLAADDGPALRLRRMSREVHQLWRMASFSALASPISRCRSRREGVVEMSWRTASARRQPCKHRRCAAPRGRRLALVHKLETTDFQRGEPRRCRPTRCDGCRCTASRCAGPTRCARR